MVSGDEAFDATSSEVTRQLSAAMYPRPDRIAALRVRRRAPAPPAQRYSRRKRTKLDGDDKCPPLGLDSARWVAGNIVGGPPVPVPSYGFDLGPVAAHALTAIRQWWLRRILCALVVAVGVLLWPLAALVWALPLLVLPAAVRSALRWRNAGLLAPILLAAWAHGSEEGLKTGLWLLPLAVLAGLTLVFLLDRLLARAAMGGTGTPWVWSPLRRRRLERLRQRQLRPELPYDARDRFVGAGRDRWSPAVISMPLRPKDPGVPRQRLDDGELLYALAWELKAPVSAEEITQRPPHLSADPVKGMPAGMWLSLTRDAKRKIDMAGLGGRAPSGRPDRLYLRIQSISWSGQIVVNVFVHAALEGDELRLTVRPQVCTPLYKEVRGLRPPPLSFRLLGNALLDVLALTWSLVRLAEPPPEPPAETPPVGLRDRYSLQEPADMHESDDAKRHVTLIQRAVFRTVQRHLDAKGIATTEFSHQVQSIFQMINIYGDNNAPVQAVAGEGVHDIDQHSKGPA